MAYSTPLDLTARGYGINSGAVNAELYKHSVNVNHTPVKVASIRVSGPDATTAKGAAIALNDVLQVFDVPAGAFVLGVTAKVVTAEGGTSTVDIGWGDDIDGFFDGLDANSTGTSFSWDESPASLATTAGVGHFFSAADTIDVKLMTGTLATAVIDLSVTYIETLPYAV